jgi:DNA-binding transcriptional MerR regulator
MYEDWGLIPKPLRKANGYRVFGDVHIDQFRLARTAFQIEVLQNGLRKRIIEVVKLSARGLYDEAINLANLYADQVELEIVNAKEAVIIANEILNSSPGEKETCLKRKELSDLLGITIDTLRNWEMNGLLKVKRRENGYRIYNSEDIKRIKIIRSLRCANYSLSSILRMMNALYQSERPDVEELLNTPSPGEEIVSACDNLIVSLKAAKINAIRIISMLEKMKIKY